MYPGFSVYLFSGEGCLQTSQYKHTKTRNYSFHLCIQISQWLDFCQKWCKKKKSNHSWLLSSRIYFVNLIPRDLSQQLVTRIDSWELEFWNFLIGYPVTHLHCFTAEIRQSLWGPAHCPNNLWTLGTRLTFCMILLCYGMFNPHPHQLIISQGFIDATVCSYTVPNNCLWDLTRK